MNGGGHQPSQQSQQPSPRDMASAAADAANSPTHANPHPQGGLQGQPGPPPHPQQMYPHQVRVSLILDKMI